MPRQCLSCIDYRERRVGAVERQELLCKGGGPVSKSYGISLGNASSATQWSA